MTADEFAATFRTMGDAGAVDEAGVGTVRPAPAGPRPCTLADIERALDVLVDVGRHDTASSVQAHAELLEAMTTVIVDAIWAAHHYRTRAHAFIEGQPEWLSITSWVPTTVAAAADSVVKWVTL